MHLTKIISGGQTGVDRGAIGAALNAGFPYGGKIPFARDAEDGQVPACFTELEEIDGGYVDRTQLNVQESDATLILNVGPHLSSGTRMTAEFALKEGAPLLVLNVRRLYEWRTQGEVPNFLAAVLTDQILMWLQLKWLGLHATRTLNVAGPRESKAPGIEALTYSLVGRVIEAAR